jgi:hypothetical protein
MNHSNLTFFGGNGNMSFSILFTMSVAAYCNLSAIRARELSRGRAFSSTSHREYAVGLLELQLHTHLVLPLLSDIVSSVSLLSPEIRWNALSTTRPIWRRDGQTGLVNSKSQSFPLGCAHLTACSVPTLQILSRAVPLPHPR